MQIREVADADIEPVYRLLVANGWAHRVANVEAMARLIRGAQRAVVALEEGEVVGFARAITDGVSNGYLSMVVVAEGWRRRGVGRALVEGVVGTDSSITWVLRADRDGAHDFFAKLGFAASTSAMGRGLEARQDRLNPDFPTDGDT